MIESPIFTPFNIGSSPCFCWPEGSLCRPSKAADRIILFRRVTGREAYFLEDALKFRAAVKLPLIYVGGMVSRQKMEEVLAAGFEGIQMARALIRDTDFVNKLHSGEIDRSQCGHSNYCIGRMYTLEMKCNRCVADLPEKLRREIEKAEERWK